MGAPSAIRSSLRARVVALLVLLTALAAWLEGPFVPPAAAARRPVPNWVGVAARPGGGYLTATSAGSVFVRGRRFRGSPASRRIRLRAPLVGIAAAPKDGYVAVTARGRVYGFGARARATVSSRALRSPVVGIAALPRGGYVLATAGGSVYAFGTRWLGSPRSAGVRLRSPVVGIAAMPRGGYALATKRGAVYPYGTRFRGSPRARSVRLRSPVVAIAAGRSGGYLLASARGSIYAYGTRFLGSPWSDGMRLRSPVVGIAVSSTGGYMVVTRSGVVLRYRAQGGLLGGAPESCASSGTVSSASTPGLLGASGQLGADEAPFSGSDLLAKLGETAFSWAASEGLGAAGGWLLSLIGAPSDSQNNALDPAEVDAQFASLNSKLDALGAQQEHDCEVLLDAINQVNQQQHKDAYYGAAKTANDDVNQIMTYEEAYSEIISALQANGGQPDDLNAELKSDMASMLGTSPGTLRGLAGSISGAMLDSNGGAYTQPGMISLYNQLLMDQGNGYNPWRTAVFPSWLVNAAYAQQAYYTGFMLDAVYMYANLAHLSFTYSGNSYTPYDQGVLDFANDVQTDIQNWSEQFTNGPSTQGKSAGWIGKGLGIGPLPDGTVLDYQDTKSPRLWTASPISLAGEPTPTRSPYYCLRYVVFCYGDRYDASGGVGGTVLSQPLNAPLSSLIAAQTPATGAGWAAVGGWQVPTPDDWKSLDPPSSSNSGLIEYAQDNGLSMLYPAGSPTYYGGTRNSKSTIEPVLVNTGTTANPTYGLLRSGSPDATSLVTQRWPFAGSDQANANAAGARIFLVKGFSPVPAPQEIKAETSSATQATRRPERRAAASAARTPAAPRLRAAATMPGAKTYTQPQACTPNGSNQSYTVPLGASAVRITATGADGAPGIAGVSSSDVQARGGPGSSVTETVPVVAQTVLYVQVGGAGGISTQDITGSRNFLPGGAGGVGGGGRGGDTINGGFNSAAHSGGGGGASGVSTSADCSHWLVVGGGGGGGGSAFTNNKQVANGGGWGASACIISGNPDCLPSGRGEGDKAGGAGGTPPDNTGGNGGGADGTTMQGGKGGSQSIQPNPNDYGSGGGGGGGGGYFGGGQGGGGSYATGGGGGGGGGADFAIPGLTLSSYFGLNDNGQHPSGTLQNGSVTITPIAQAPAPISFSASATSTVWGQPPTLTATVPVNAAGIVGFYEDVNGGCDGSKAAGAACPGLGTAPVNQGVATLTAPTHPLEIGSHSIYAYYLGTSADYNGDQHYLGSRSASVTITVGQAAPNPTLVILHSQLTPGQSPKSLVTQVPADATGSVTFTAAGPNGPYTLGTAKVQDGYATLTNPQPPLPAGNYSVTASYSGDAHYAPAKSDPPQIISVQSPSSG